MTPANGAVRPISSAGTVSTIGTSTSTPGVPAKAAVICGRTGAISTAPSTDMQLPASSRISCAIPGVRLGAPARPFGESGDPASGVTGVFRTVSSDMVITWFVVGPWRIWG